MSKWEYDKTKIPKRPGIKFLGLWHHPHGTDVVRIIWRASKSVDSFDYLADSRGYGDYFVATPDAFCRIPKINRPKGFQT